MKFTRSVEIGRPIGEVIRLFDNVDNLKEWQDGFVSLDHIGGTPGQPGAKSRIIYNTGKHVIELTETIQVKNLPVEMTALYEHKHMVNTMTNRFTPMGENKTKWTVEIEYTKFIGFIPRMMAMLMPGIFKKQVQKWLDQFKVFAEKELQPKYKPQTS